MISEADARQVPALQKSAVREHRAGTAPDDERLRAAAVWQYAHYDDPAGP